MTLSDEDVERIVSAVETIEASLSVLAEKQTISRDRYHNDRETRDIVERRFVKLTEGTLDIARTLVVAETGSRPIVATTPSNGTSSVTGPFTAWVRIRPDRIDGCFGKPVLDAQATPWARAPSCSTV